MGRPHRFYVAPADRELRHKLWIDDGALVHQWLNVLRYKVGDELILFDGERHERLYKIELIKPSSCLLQHVTDLKVKHPERHVHLFWSLLQGHNNDLVIQKATELGVSALTPIITSRTSSGKHLNPERANRLIIEASEQCGRVNLPQLHEGSGLVEAVHTYKDKLILYFAHTEAADEPSSSRSDDLGLFIGPEGGWSKDDIKLLRENHVQAFSLGSFVLRAETAAVVAVAKLI